MRTRYLLNIVDAPPHTLSVLSALAKTYRSNVSIEERITDAYNFAMSRVNDAHDFLGVDNLFKDKESMEMMVTEVDSTIRSVSLPERVNRFNAVARWGRGYKSTMLLMEHNWDG